MKALAVIPVVALACSCPTAEIDDIPELARYALINAGWDRYVTEHVGGIRYVSREDVARICDNENHTETGCTWWDACGCIQTVVVIEGRTALDVAGTLVHEAAHHAECGLFDDGSEDCASGAEARFYDDYWGN